MTKNTYVLSFLKQADEIKTATGCDIYMEMRYENKIHLYKSETSQVMPYVENVCRYYRYTLTLNKVENGYG